jgi:hypothetical protein
MKNTPTRVFFICGAGARCLRTLRQGSNGGAVVACDPCLNLFELPYIKRQSFLKNCFLSSFNHPAILYVMWKIPSVTKIYEALGAVADGRINVDGNSGTCYSSSGNKYYDINFDQDSKAITSNDNTSYWKGELGYPAVAFLLKVGVLEYRPNMGNLLKGIPWKDINQKFKNDFDVALEYVLQDMSDSDRADLKKYAESLVEDIKKLGLKKLGKQTVPPKGY